MNREEKPTELIGESINESINNAGYSVKGISAKLLFSQVKNTIPFIYHSVFQESLDRKKHAFLWTLIEGNEPQNSFEYFKLCVSAHFGTVASFVPTDVDNQIRSKLWSASLPLATLEKMAELVLESYFWDTHKVSSRWVRSPESGEDVAGHMGEWFSISAAAYGAVRKKNPDLAATLAGQIMREMQKELQVFEEFQKAQNGIGMLKASTLIAHNLGDLDRVIEQWNFPVDDPLRVAAFKAGHEDKPSFGLRFKKIGDLNKAFMAAENHRHFALRKVKPLRGSVDFFIPLGPFFDDWGGVLARHPQMSPEDLGEVIEALLDGWDWLKGSAVGYCRALSGIEESFEGGLSQLCKYIPSRTAKNLKSGEIRKQTSIPRKRFEDKYNQIAVNFIK